ncbi:MAG: VWA domain-containing protein [Polyangiaceae bacterium]
MRKALLTLFTVGLVGAFLIPSCAKDDKSGDKSGEEGGTSSGGASSTAKGGAKAKGGSTSTGGVSAGGASTTEVEACKDLNIVSDTGEACNSTNMSAVYSDIHMLIVLDKSGSIDQSPVGFNGKTKWAATKEALTAALQSSNDQVRYGLVMYPYSEGEPIPADCGLRCCELPTGSAAVNVPIKDAAESVPAILDKLENTNPGGGTPTALALAAAYDYYINGPGVNLPAGDKYVMLATDGGPNCSEGITCESATCTADMDKQGSCGTKTINCCAESLASSGGGPTLCLDDQGVLEQIRNLRDKGIKTFVVGIPGTENYKTYLTAFADAGGAPDPKNETLKYYEVSAAQGVEGLTQTFKSITESLVRSCDVKLANAPVDSGKLNVAVECELLQQGEGDAVNWVYNENADDPVITIKGDTCNRIETQGVTRIDVIEGCTTIILQ